MVKSSDYWKKRLENIAATQNKKADDYIETLELQYKKAMVSIQRDLEAFYARYANAEGVDMATARKLLSKAEKELWEVSLEEYRKMALDEEFIDQIESMYSKSRVSRLKALEMQIRAQLETLYSELNTELGALLTDTFADTYYQTVYEIQKGTGIGTNFALFNEDAVKKIVSKPWKWGHFSSTVWNNKELLLGELETALSQAFIRGDRIDKVIKKFDKRMGVGYSRAANIIQTEHAYIAGEATFKGYEETGVEKYEYLATLDTRTSQICRDMDGKTFKLSEKVVWINYPPLHCRCRSTTVPYFEDEESYGKRIARDYEGKVYYVPEEMAYHDWYDKYVKGNPDELLAEKKHQNRHSDKKQYERYKELLGKEVPRSLDEFQNLKYTDSIKWTELKDKFKVETRKYKEYLFNDDGTIIITDDWKGQHVSIPRKYKAYAVVETDSIFNNGKVQIDRTLYDKDGMMYKQVHSGHHNKPKQHPYGKYGEHVHYYNWNTETGRPERGVLELTEQDKIEHSDILKGVE